jgi:hypothetical protein
VNNEFKDLDTINVSSNMLSKFKECNNELELLVKEITFEFNNSDFQDIEINKILNEVKNKVEIDQNIEYTMM